MALSKSEVDFVAYDDHGQVVLLGEVKSRRGTSAAWAAQFRRNMLAHGRLPASLFFLIATPERMYFWRQNEANTIDELPQFTMDAANELKPYFERFSQKPEETSGQALELIVLTWLNEMAQLGQQRTKQDSSLRWLAELGLLNALGKARIELSAVQ